MNSGYLSYSLPLFERFSENQGKRYSTENSHRRLQQSLLANLSELLNTHSPLAPSLETQYQQVLGSVVAYGMPALSGKTASTVDIRALERQVRTVITQYEPRLIAETVIVSADISSGYFSRYNKVCLSISGMAKWQPNPMEFGLVAELDLESNRIVITLA